MQEGQNIIQGSGVVPSVTEIKSPPTHTNNRLTIRLFPYLRSVGKSSVERSANVFQTPIEIPLKIENKMTLRVSAETATLSGGMRRRKRDSAERDRLIAVLVRRKREGMEERTGTHDKHTHTHHTRTHGRMHAHMHARTHAHTHSLIHSDLHMHLRSTTMAVMIVPGMEEAANTKASL